MMPLPKFCFLVFLICFLQYGQLLAQESYYSKSVHVFQSQQFDSARNYILLAIQEFQKNRQQDSLVLAYVHQADLEWDTRGIKKAIEVAGLAVEASKKLPENNLIRITALNKRGQLLVHMTRTEEAKLSFQEAEKNLPKNDTVNSTVASLFNNISWMYLNLNQFEQAQRYAQRSLQIQLSLYGEDARQLMGVYQSLGLIASWAGWFEDAEKYSLKLYDIAQKHLSPAHPTMGLVHNQLVVVYESMCRYPEALRHLKAMVEVTQHSYAQSGNPHFLAIAYNNTGFLYHQLGENSLAEAYFEKALRLHKDNFGEDEVGIVQPLAHLAEAKRSLGKYAEADSLFSVAYRVQTKIDQENIRGLADLESQIGGLYEDQENYKMAEQWYLLALNRYRNAGVDGTTMVDETKTSLGSTYAKQGEKDKAIQLHEEVLESYRKKYQKGNLLIAGKWNRISEAYRLASDWDLALQFSDSTFLELLGLRIFPKDNWIESLPISGSIAEFLHNRILILESQFQAKPEKWILDTIIQMVEDYGSYMEQTIAGLRAENTLIDLAKKQKRLYQSGIHAAWMLSEKYNESHKLETAFEFAERGKGILLRLAANNLVVDEHASDENDIFSTDRKWRGTISALNSRYLNTGGTNDTILNELSEAIESYKDFQDSVRHLGDSRWTARFNLRPYRIEDIRKLLLKNNQTLIEYAATEHHIYIFLIGQEHFKVFRHPRKPIQSQVEILQALQQLNVGEFVGASFSLYESLIQPVSRYIKGNQLLIIPDVELYGINFEVLVSDNKLTGFSDLNYLLKQFEVTYLLSASSAVQQKRVWDNKGKNARFLAPGFTQKMNEGYRARVEERPEEDPIHAQLIRQPFSLVAARKAVSMFGGELYLEEEAQEKNFRNDAANLRILHLGTHAEVNHLSPLHSRLFLAKSSLADSVQDDGILHAFEVYSMQLKAELAVLSACGTGTGKFQDGEGMISLAHSFLHTGCASVVMSMWAIDEKTSADILTDFYRNLSEGMRKSQALREAKLQFLNGAPAELAHPYYWAGLGLIGDAAPLSSQISYRKNIYWLFGFVTLLFLGWLFWMYRWKSALLRT